MSIIIKLLGLPLEANSVDVRLSFLGLTIPDGGVHIVGGKEGLVFIEFANAEDARQAMTQTGRIIKNSCIRLILSSRDEMQYVISSVQQQYMQRQQQPLLPWIQQQSQHPRIQPSSLQPEPISRQQQLHRRDGRARGRSGLGRGDVKLFQDKKCILVATNIAHRATLKDILDFLSDFNMSEDNIRLCLNRRGQPTGTAKIAFPTPEAATRALKLINKKHLCGRPVTLKLN